MSRLYAVSLFVFGILAILPFLDHTGVAFAQQMRGPNGEKCDSPAACERR